MKTPGGSPPRSSWTDDWQPRTAEEADLVYGLRLAWQIDRAERFETAHLSHRVRKAQWRATGMPDPERLQDVANLGSKLLGYAYTGSRAVVLARLQATAEGCRWLLDRWREIELLQGQGSSAEKADMYRWLYLLGKQLEDAITEPAANAVLVAWNVLKPASPRRCGNTSRTSCRRTRWSTLLWQAAASPGLGPPMRPRR